MARSAVLDVIVARAEAAAHETGWPSPAADHLFLELIAEPDIRAAMVTAGCDVVALEAAVAASLRDAPPPPEFRGVAPWLAQIESVVSSPLTHRVVLGHLLRVPQLELVLESHGALSVEVLYVLAHGVALRDPRAVAPLPTAKLHRDARGEHARSGAYRVVIHNDDFTTFKCVQHVLVDWFEKPSQVAREIANAVNVSGRMVIGSYGLRQAIRLVDRATRDAHDAGYPLRFSLEPDEPGDEGVID